MKVSEYKEEEVANNDEKRKIMIANQNILDTQRQKYIYLSIICSRNDNNYNVQPKKKCNVQVCIW